MTSPQAPAVHTDVEACVDAVLAEVGDHVVLGLPLGLGKANRFANALYRRAVSDASIRLDIITALSLQRPAPSSDLERRMFGPLAERLFGDYPELEYNVALRKGSLPPNVTLSEFYFQPGARLRQPHAQQHYISSNYSHVARDALARGINVIGQLVARRGEGAEAELSLSCNPDLTLDLLPVLLERKRAGTPVALVAEINDNLPFMGNDAAVALAAFDHVIATPAPHFGLFGIPNEAVTPQAYAAGLHASALVRDGGTIQLGIGSFSDAVTHALQFRHAEPERWRAALCRLDSTADLDGMGRFDEGLYAASEMLVAGLVALLEDGILARRVYNHPALQALANARALPEKPSIELLTALWDTGHLPPVMTEGDFARLRHHGVFTSDAAYAHGEVEWNGVRVLARLDSAEARERLAEHCLGPAVTGGVVAHGGFFLGSQGFYEALRNLPQESRDLANMTGIGFINELHGDEILKRLQRKDAVFVNNAMMVTLGGAVVSDGLADHQVVSGVGGQYNFVAMAHALDDARSAIVVWSSRTKNGRRSSNIVWQYPHTTIPRHLRDVVITEYGVADLRGKGDRDVAVALIEIADAEFQDELVERAKAAGKVEADYRVPDTARRNTPERVETAVAELRGGGWFAPYPLGTELTEVEQDLARALKWLQARAGRMRDRAGLAWQVLVAERPRQRYRAHLSRLGLDAPKGVGEWLTRRLVALALDRTVQDEAQRARARLRS